MQCSVHFVVVVILFSIWTAVVSSKIYIVTLCEEYECLAPFKQYSLYIRESIQIIPDWCCKIIKLTVRPISCHHPRSSSLPHVDAGPTISSTYGMLPGSPFLSECQVLSAIQSGSQWYKTGVLSASISFLEIGGSHRVPNQGSTVGGGWQPFLFHQKHLGEDGSVRQGVVMVKQSGLFSPNFRVMSSHVSMQSPQNVEVPGIHSVAC
jgi:hypothetical protein